MTLSEFGKVFGVLAIQLRASDVDEASMRAYYEVLKPLDLELVQLAAKRFAETPNGTGAWFPKTAEWKAMAAQIANERAEQLRGLLRARREPLCLECQDTGWRYGEDDRVRRCACQALRRLEIIGRRPMPPLPEAR